MKLMGILSVLVIITSLFYTKDADAAYRLTANVELRGHHGKCLDIRGPSTAAGTDVQLYECQQVGQQLWDVWSDGTIRSSWAGGKCLDIENAAHIVQIYDCVNVPQQKWSVSLGKVYSLDYRNGKRCLDVINGGSHDGASVQVYPCRSVDQQEWKVRKTELRHSFSLSHSGRFNLATTIPLSCYEGTDHGIPYDSYLCRYVKGTSGDNTANQFFWKKASDVLEQSSHSLHGRMLIDANGAMYEGCALIYRWNWYRCDYRTGGHFSLTPGHENPLRRVWDWARYTGDNLGCAASLSAAWAKGAVRNALPLAIVGCDHGPLRFSHNTIPGFND